MPDVKTSISIELLYLIGSIKQNHRNQCISRQRPYHIEHTSSRPITEVKQCWARLVLGWVTTWEHWVLLASILFLIIFFHYKYKSDTYTLEKSSSEIMFSKYLLKLTLWINIIGASIYEYKNFYIWLTYKDEKLPYILANGHITLNIPVLVRSLKSSNVEPV